MADGGIEYSYELMKKIAGNMWRFVEKLAGKIGEEMGGESGVERDVLLEYMPLSPTSYTPTPSLLPRASDVTTNYSHI
jgi:hypothetical protein